MAAISMAANVRWTYTLDRMCTAFILALAAFVPAFAIDPARAADGYRSSIVPETATLKWRTLPLSDPRLA